MKNFGIWLILIIVGGVACQKSSFITSADAVLLTSADTLHFDTVFTTTGSVTQSFKIFNNNDRKLRLSNVQLGGGASSYFKLNVDGSPGVNFTDIEVAANDSIYVFVSVSINPNTDALPFVVQDSVLINYNGNTRLVQLEAFGQNANFIRSRRITTNTSWNNALPYVILGGVAIDPGVTLTIDRGTKIYAHADAPIIINGSLRVNGTLAEKVMFKGDRLDVPYNDFPGSWPGIYFTETSSNNVLNYAVVQNAYQGIITQEALSAAFKIELNECTIDNVYDAGIISVNSSIKARNCLISNCGRNIALGGGNYQFDHCTVVTYGNDYIEHNNPVLFITDEYTENVTRPLSGLFRNCIFYGEGGRAKNEIVVTKKGANFNLNFQHVLYKAKTPPLAGTFNTASIVNEPPQFDSVSTNRRFYNFRLKPTSPAFRKGLNIGIGTDIDGNTRSTVTPDIGCYETQ